MISLLRRTKPAKPRREISEPTVAHEFEQAAEDAMAEAVAQFPLSYKPVVEWRRYSVTAGMANYRMGVISLSSIVLKDVASIRETFLHEYAHLLAYDRHGRKGAGHGAHWKQAMRDLGLEPKVHHHYDVVRNKSHQVVIYRCKKCGQSFAKKRQFSRGKRYFHRTCGGFIELVEIRRATSETELT